MHFSVNCDDSGTFLLLPLFCCSDYKRKENPISDDDRKIMFYIFIQMKDQFKFSIRVFNLLWQS